MLISSRPNLTKHLNECQVLNAYSFSKAGSEGAERYEIRYGIDGVVADGADKKFIQQSVGLEIQSFVR